MHPSNRSIDLIDDERGTAAPEFILVGLVLLVPILYLVVTLGIVQQHTLGAEAGARHIARTIATAHEGDADARAIAVREAIIDEYGLDADRVDVVVACVPVSVTCPEPGGMIAVTVRTAVALPLVPPVFGLDRHAVIPIEARAVQKISRLWGEP